MAMLIDAHDVLVRGCAEKRLTFIEFLAAYAEFPRGYGLEQETVSADERDVLRMFAKRIEFHRRVAGVIAGLRAMGKAGSLSGEIGEFLPRVGLMRLEELVARYPTLEVVARRE